MSNVDAIGALVNAAKPSELPGLAGELARALADVLARSAAPLSPLARTSAPEDADVLLTVVEAAERLSVPKSWIYRHARTLPFTRKLGYRTLRFDARALERWANARPAR